MAATQWDVAGNSVGLSGYGEPDFWKRHYCDTSGTHDWLVQWNAFEDVFCRYVERDKPCKILQPGCGNSQLAEEMYDAGFRDILSTDCSEAIIDQMAARTAKCAGLQWECMDATDMQLQDESFDVVVDKAVLDALVTGENARIVSASYVKEVFRVLRCGGLFICVTLTSRRSYFELGPWKFEVLETAEIFRCNKAFYVDVCRKTQATAELLSLWPDILGMLRRGATLQAFSKTEDIHGALLLTDKVNVGDIVEVDTEFTSGDSPSRAVLLEKGLRGVVNIVDDDGDAVVLFPGLAGVDCAERFVLSEQLHNLRVFQTQVSEVHVEGASH